MMFKREFQRAKQAQLFITLTWNRKGHGEKTHRHCTCLPLLQVKKKKCWYRTFIGGMGAGWSLTLCPGPASCVALTCPGEESMYCCLLGFSSLVAPKGLTWGRERLRNNSCFSKPGQFHSVSETCQWDLEKR